MRLPQRTTTIGDENNVIIFLRFLLFFLFLGNYMYMSMKTHMASFCMQSSYDMCEFTHPKNLTMLYF